MDDHPLIGRIDDGRLIVGNGDGARSSIFLNGQLSAMGDKWGQPRQRTKQQNARERGHHGRLAFHENGRETDLALLAGAAESAIFWVEKSDVQVIRFPLFEGAKTGVGLFVGVNNGDAQT